MGMLTRDEMEAVIQGGGSVLVNRQVISSVDALPSAAQLREIEAQQHAGVQQALQTRRDALDAALAEHRGAHTVPGASGDAGEHHARGRKGD